MSKVKNAIEWHCLNCDAYGAGEPVHYCGYNEELIVVQECDEE